MRAAMLVLNDMRADARVEREASALAEAGHEVAVFCLRSAGVPECEDRAGFQILRCADYSTKSWRSPVAKMRELVARSSALRDAAIAWRPEVVHAHDSDTLAAARAAADKVGARLVYDAHEPYPDMLKEFGSQGSWPVQAYWKRLERRLVPRADAVITVSDGLAAELVRRFDVNPVVVRNVCSLVPIGSPSRLRSELGLSDDSRLLILYQGVLIPGRGLVRLIEAVAQVSDVVLVVQGFGPEKEAMQLRVQQLGIEDRVRFMGRKAPSELHDYASGADAGVVIYEHTTLNNYLAAPNKLYAYFMAGLPVMSSDFPGLSGIVEGGGTGVTFNPSDTSSIVAAIRALTDPDSRKKMGARARELAETRYNWDIEKQKLLELYERLATRSTS